MSVIISVIGADQASDEYQGALRLKSLLEHSLPDNAIGQITLHANATVFGQEVKDIDILMDTLFQKLCIHEWKQRYDDPCVCDGTQWELELMFQNQLTEGIAATGIKG